MLKELYRNQMDTALIKIIQEKIFFCCRAMVISASFAGCSQSPSNDVSSYDLSSKVTLPTVSKEQTSIWPNIKSDIKKDPVIEARIGVLLAQMSNEEKVGQIIQPELKRVTPADVKAFHLGSILNGGGTFPNNDKHATADDWISVAERFYQASMDVSDGGVAVPIIWGTDAVHGHNNIIGATLFPHNIGLGAANNPELMRQIGEATASEVSATGITWVFAPTVAAPQDDRWGRTYEGYSESPEIIYAYAGEIVKGMQGQARTDELFADQRVVSTVKHFVGDGGTTLGVDRRNTQISEQELFEIHAQGYVSALAAGAQTVMASFNSWNGKRMHDHKYLLTDVLKDTMGFDGFVVGDWNGHAFIDGCTSASCPEAINAGLDMFMAPEKDWKELYANTLAQVNDGTISRSRIDDAVARILRVKLRSGLFEHGPAARTSAESKKRIGSEKHRKIARQAVRESLVLLKNNNNLLPLNKKMNILVAGDGADNIGKQSGGWTLSWQGTGNENTDFPGGSSIYAGIKATVEAAGGNVQLSESGAYTHKPDVAIVVYGENPYAEMQGDVHSIEYQAGEHTDLVLLKRLKAEGIPVVSIFLTGRALWVNPEINASDAFVVAWLPGSEGIAVADVLFQSKSSDLKAHSDSAYDFTGRLSFSWPMHTDQQANFTQTAPAPLFALGYGLSYQDSGVNMTLLQETVATSASVAHTTHAIFNGRAMKPWQLVLRDANGQVIPMLNSVERNKNMTIESVDRFVQHDSRQITWLGNGTAHVELMAVEPQNLSDMLQRNTSINFDVRLHQYAQDEVFFGMACDGNCKAQVPIADTLNSLPPHQWQTISIRAECIIDAGMDFSKLRTVFSLFTHTELQLTINNVYLSTEKVFADDYSCDNPFDTQ